MTGSGQQQLEKKNQNATRVTKLVVMTKKKRQMRSGMRVGYGRHDTRRMKKRGDFGAAAAAEEEDVQV